jgi:hypothetical protein
VSPASSDGPRWYRRGWVIGLIALILGFGLGAILGGSKTTTTSLTFPPQTVVQTVNGHLPIVTKTVRGRTQIVTIPGPTKTVTKTVPGPTKTVTVPGP